MRVRVLNSGSSSLKFAVLDVAPGHGGGDRGAGRPVPGGADAVVFGGGIGEQAPGGGERGKHG
jgi:acetate kinase